VSGGCHSRKCSDGHGPAEHLFRLLPCGPRRTGLTRTSIAAVGPGPSTHELRTLPLVRPPPNLPTLVVLVRIFHRIGEEAPPDFGAITPPVGVGQTGPVNPVIIEVALNGPTRRSRQPHVPISSAEIAESGRKCAQAGASIVHQHDDFATLATSPLGTGPEGMAAAGLAAYAGLLPHHPDIFVYPTANFRGPTIQDRWDHHRVLAREMPAQGLGPLRMGLVDPGSVTLGNFVYGYRRDEVEYKFAACAELGLAPSIACFEPGYVRSVLDFYESGRLPAGSLVKFYLCAGPPLFGLPAEPWALETYLRMIEGTDLPWAVAVLGGDVVASGLADMAIELGGHVRVGLEDYADPTGRQPTNEELVAEVADLARRSGRGVASPTEAATILGCR